MDDDECIMSNAIRKVVFVESLGVLHFKGNSKKNSTNLLAGQLSTPSDLDLLQLVGRIEKKNWIHSQENQASGSQTRTTAHIHGSGWEFQSSGNEIAVAITTVQHIRGFETEDDDRQLTQA
ncbi:hypothetical protein T265_03806 [Opisthorchis viverrini]|uniref:Uncharacterized protein n=1 Tax=Opisthorchis viverrini TaxID=6198 RepID=A0A074ZR70_OPIVI|nr:hypothetical protein T265_03806 [Opisthorchis viverrini]KER29606.1 hypothetical protein T265_03806 [Opisthorchis viverrini]